jgi:hypothetical protein
MKELVGPCKGCGKDIYCLEGFLNGVLTKEKEIFCFDCNEGLAKIEENPQK